MIYKHLVFIIIFAFIACNDTSKDTNASVNIFESNASDENLSKGKNYDELIEFKSKEKNLNYLFEDSKFPVDDYILRAGKKTQSQNVYEAFKESKKNQESLDEIKKQQEAEFRKKIQAELLEKGGARKGNMLLDKDGKPILDANGNPMYDNILYDENGNPILDANGNPRYKNVLYDEKGYPLYDKNGNIITKQALKDNENKGEPILDNNGNIKFDKDGKPMYDNVAYDDKGNVIYNKDGLIALLDDPKKGKMLLDKDGKPLLDCNNEPMYENILYDEKQCPILDENGQVMMKDKIPPNSALAKEKQELQKLIDEQKKLNKQMKQAINNAQNGANGNINGVSGAYYPYNVNSLIRDSVLAERGNTNIAFSKPSTRYGVSSFSNQKNIDESTHEHRLFRTIRAGRLIPALLTTAISSDIEAPVTAIVEQDIYAAMGKAVLIPRGSKVIGFYQNDNKIGQERLSIVWREIITPQGVNILLTKATTSDNLGMSGARGAVNNKYFDRYGIPYGISTLSNVLLLALASKTSGNVYAESIYQQSSKDVSTLVENIIEQQAQIKPTIEIKAGSRIFITPSAHIWFPIPQNGAVMAEFFNDDI